MSISRRQWLMALLFLPLTGCGYRLRGQIAGSSRARLPKRILVQHEGVDGELLLQTQRALSAFGAQLVSDRQQAELIVTLGQTQQQSVISAIGAYGEIAARLFIMIQPLRVTQSDASLPLIDTLIRRSREVDQSLAFELGGLGAERPLAITRESNEVIADVRARVVDAIVRILQSLVPLEESG